MAAPRTEPAVSTAAITKFPTGETARRGGSFQGTRREALAWKSDYRTGLPINYRNCRGNFRVARYRGGSENKEEEDDFTVRRETQERERDLARFDDASLAE